MSSDLGTVVGNGRFDEDSSFDSSKSKADTFSSEGFWSGYGIFFVILIILCIIGIILALLFIILGKKFKKNKRSTTTGTITTTKDVELKDISSNPKYQPVPIV